MKKKELETMVWELELAKKEYQIRKLERDAKTYRDIIEKLQPDRSYTQTNMCKRGEWCNACVFNKVYTMSSYGNPINICEKHLACEGFTPVKEGSDA